MSIKSTASAASIPIRFLIIIRISVNAQWLMTRYCGAILSVVAWEISVHIILICSLCWYFLVDYCASNLVKDLVDVESSLGRGLKKLKAVLLSERSSTLALYDFIVSVALIRD